MSKLISSPARAAEAPAADRHGGIDWGKVFAFPNPVNEYSARITAALVVLLSLVTLLTGFGWGLAVIAAGFWLRVLFGPRISPFGVLSVKVLTPLLGKKRLVPGPPKRFAQGIGAALSTAAAMLFAAGLAPGRLGPARGPDRRRLAGGLRRLLPRLRDLRAAAAPRTHPRGCLRSLQQHFAQAPVTAASRPAMPRMTSGASRAASQSAGRHSSP